MNNNVEHPKHYVQGEIECIDCIKAATVNKVGIEAFCVGNAIKYLFRYENKNGIEDVEKSMWYLNRLLKELKEKQHKKNNSVDECINDNLEQEDFCSNCKHYKNIDYFDICSKCCNNYFLSDERSTSLPSQFESKSK